MNKLVSIIIPTYKGWSNLSRAIESCCRQSYKNIEIIIVDDNGGGNSNENRNKTQSIVEKYSLDYPTISIQYIEHMINKGGAAARNTGIEISSGAYVCFLDDDDVYLRERIEKSVIFLESNQFADGVVCQVLSTSEDFEGLIKLTQIRDTNNFDEKLLVDTMHIGTGSNLFFRRGSMERVSDFDENFIRFQDLEYLIRFANKMSIGLIDEFLIIKSTNETNNLPDYYKLKDAWILLLDQSENTLEKVKKENTSYKLFKRTQKEIFTYPMSLLSWGKIINEYSSLNLSFFEIALLKIRLPFKKVKIYQYLKKRSLLRGEVNKMNLAYDSAHIQFSELVIKNGEVLSELF